MQTQDNLQNYIGQKVGIYRNLNRGGFSVHAKAGKSLKVVGYCQSATLHRVKLKVSESARQRIIHNRRREVHAMAYGTPDQLRL